MAMEAVAIVLAILGGLFVAFFRGRKSGKTEAKIAQVEETEEKIEKVQESDNAVNSQDRASLIESLSADSLRRHP
jgi:flagellar basal body-associated protein FliL